MRQMVLDPRVIQHLGGDLITSSEVAVIELIKNSIDAKANNIIINLYNDRTLRDLTTDKTILSLVPEKYHTRSIFIIEDDGYGMNDTQLTNGFLKVGCNLKKGEEDTLGEKGIGRLAAQRLGKALLVETSSADPEEENSFFVFIDWEKIASGILDTPDAIGEKLAHFTKLWIFDIKLEDYLENAYQFEQLNLLGTSPQAILNNDLRSAIGFLKSPFESTNGAKIVFRFNDQPLSFEFPKEMLKLAETIHSFSFNADNKSNQISLKYEIILKAWFAERVHRATVQSESFKRLKKPHIFYNELIKKNNRRLQNVLQYSMSEEDLHHLLVESLDDIFPSSTELPILEEKRKEFINEKAIDIIKRLSMISPIKGQIYSFKQDVPVGEKIALESAIELGEVSENLTRKMVQNFLKNYNGIKLYRGEYRIGFLGNKENDWIKLQQYRTKGQQWYRFDLGNTVGQVTLQDLKQDYIKETSSRLELSENETSIAFKYLINIVFNRLFYDLNRKANDIIKVLLEEENVLGESLPKKVEKNETTIQHMMARNRKMEKTLATIASELKNSVDLGDNRVALSTVHFTKIQKAVQDITDDVRKDAIDQLNTKAMLSETDELYKLLKRETYNNYKLMANGLITETITHELHSVTTTGMIKDADEHFDYLKKYFITTKEGKIYNKHVYPIRNGYHSLENNLAKIGDLYSFLESTFITKDSYNVFVTQNIAEVIEDVKKNLLGMLQNKKINIICTTGDMEWKAPKGVMLHVLYNLVTNSIYWIDTRRERAKTDPLYNVSHADYILVEDDDEGNIIVSDTGTGVVKNMEDILFEALQSGKPMNEGRGMGLYIVKELLKSFGSNISLLDERNAFGNRFKFMIRTTLKEE